MARILARLNAVYFLNNPKPVLQVFSFEDFLKASIHAGCSLSALSPLG